MERDRGAHRFQDLRDGGVTVIRKVTLSTAAGLVLALLTVALAAMPDTYRQAYDAGAVDGKAAGDQDRRDGLPFDFANKKAYQAADRGFDDAAHDRDVYVVAYRRGFEDAYEEAYGLSTVSASPAPAAASGPRDNPPTRVRSGELSAGTELRVKLLDTLSTRRNERGDRFRAEVIEEFFEGSQVLIPRGTLVLGVVRQSKRAGRIKGRAQLILGFEELEFPDGQRVPIDALVSSVEKRAGGTVKDEEGTVQGRGTKAEDAKKVGTSAGIGALIGVISGGGRGARAGGIIGGAAGLAGVLFTRGEDIVLYSETELAIRLSRAAVLGSAQRNP